MRKLLIAATILFSANLPASGQERQVPQTAAQVQLSFAPVVARVAPAVVNVYASRVVRHAYNPFANDPFFNRFFGGQERARVQQSLGSGVIVRAEGIIITNNHVVQGAQDIKIALSDRREFQATVVLTDARTDLAVLKIEARGERLPIIEFGDSDRVQVGDLVLAIGDPFGVGQTVTSGIVSALSRTQMGATDYQFFIQTDAAINPGNSGGALVTLDGRLVGINTSIATPSGGSVGIGFAVPANMARRVVEGAMGGGIRRPWFGAQAQAVTADIARGLGLARPQGILVSQVYPGSPAAQAGLTRGDVILTIDGFEVNDPQGLNYRIGTRRTGETAHIRYNRAGMVRDAVARLVVPPDTGRDERLLQGRHPLQGVRVANVTPALADERQMDWAVQGVVITEPGQSAQLGLREGDVVRQVNGMDINTVATLQRALVAQGWDIVIQRGDRVLTLSL